MGFELFSQNFAAQGSCKISVKVQSGVCEYFFALWQTQNANARVFPIRQPSWPRERLPSANNVLQSKSEHSQSHLRSSNLKLIRSKVFINIKSSSAPFDRKVLQAPGLGLVASDHCISYWFHSTASASWLNQVLPFWPKIFLSIILLPYIYESSLIKAKEAVRVCWCSQGGSSTCPRSSMNIQAQGCLKVVQQCRKILNLAMPRTKTQVKTLWIQGEKGGKIRNRVGIENSKERGAGFSCQHENWWQQLFWEGAFLFSLVTWLDTQTLTSCLPWFPNFSRAGTCTSPTTKLTSSTMLNKTRNCSSSLRPSSTGCPCHTAEHLALSLVGTFSWF